ncbi:MAG: type II toxin-antitoxin system PemK/MazF family toxin [Candidatus Bipolaricaulota bacterium]|nr:type II toxin-antitoxin system PemK/MazF family toxin [Candidatus Bipolaricaulota bacterium]
MWWADLGKPIGSEPVYRRPVIIVQGNSFNRSKISTVVCVPLTSNVRWADAPGNVLLDARATGLPKDSVANVSQVITLDKSALKERTGALPNAKLDLCSSGSTSCSHGRGLIVGPAGRVDMAIDAVTGREAARSSSAPRYTRRKRLFNVFSG